MQFQKAEVWQSFTSDTEKYVNMPIFPIPIPVLSDSQLGSPVHPTQTHAAMLIKKLKILLLHLQVNYAHTREAFNKNNRLQAQIPRVLSCHNSLVQYKGTNVSKCTKLLQQYCTVVLFCLLVLHHSVVTGQYPNKLCLKSNETPKQGYTWNVTISYVQWME